MLWFFIACFESAQNNLITEDEIEKVAMSIDANTSIPKRIKARHILIAHKNALNARPSLRRNRSSAKALAHELLQQLKAGASFETLSKQYGDDPSASKGGMLGVFEANQMMENFSRMAFHLKEDELGICETIFGYHIVQRLPLDERTFKHLIIQWQGAYLSTSTHTKESAQQKIDHAYRELEMGVDINTLIQTYSEGPMASRGGSTGWIEKKDLGAALRTPAFALDVGAYTVPLESKLGYHILYRQE